MSGVGQIETKSLHKAMLRKYLLIAHHPPQSRKQRVAKCVAVRARCQAIRSLLYSGFYPTVRAALKISGDCIAAPAFIPTAGATRWQKSAARYTRKRLGEREKNVSTG